MIIASLIYLIPAFVFYKLITTYLLLSYIPGPLLNKFTDIPRLLSVLRRKPHEDQLHLHRKHGDLVRLGPNMISMAGGSPEVNYIHQIYGIGKGLVKSDFYAVFQNIVNGRRAASLVAMTDESEHARTKRTIAHAYSLSTLVEFEPLVDSTTTVFLRELEERFAVVPKSARRPCDLGRWLQFYAFDVIGELTFSKRLGFIETGEDVNDIIGSIGANFDYFSVLGQMPWLDETFLGKNPIYVKYFRKPVASPILKFAQRLLQERLEEVEDGKGADDESGRKPDFLTRFLRTRKDSEEPMSDGQMLSLLFMNINAGSDTIASTLRAIFYYLLMNPSTMDTLIQELTQAHDAGHLSLPCPTWHETQSEHTPYLRAVIKEGLRLNPALSLPLERVVPKDGMNLSVTQPTSKSWSPANNRSKTTWNNKTDNVFLPGGTIIGINPYVHHRNTTIFGEDANDWNPSRWLIPTPVLSSEPTDQKQAPTDITNNVVIKDNTNEQIKLMELNILSFGAGKRSCMGRNIAMLELQKLIPAMVMKFKFSWADSAHDGSKWRLRNSWILTGDGLVVDVELR